MEKGYLVPKEIAETMVASGTKKVTLQSYKVMLLAILAGLFIGLGGHGYITVIQTLANIDIGLMKFMGASVFPIGLMLVILAGGELFTGNNLMTLALMDKKITLKQLLKSWLIAYIGNFIGAMLLVLLLVYSGLYHSDTIRSMATSIASNKLTLSFGSAFIRGVLCNIIVVLAIWLATGAKDTVSKIFACWFPIMLFVLSGFEHSIANMFFIPLGKLLGLEVTWAALFIKNLLPVTLGNIVGGGIIIPGVYYLTYILPNKKAKKSDAL